jgi:hypothetical protein
LNPRTATIIIFIGVALLGVGSSLFVNPLTTHNTESLWINPMNGDDISFRFPSGDIVECSVTVRYGDERITTTVRDPIGEIVYQRMISGGDSFIVRAEREGVYSFSFLNLEDSNKTVYLTLERQILDRITVIGLLAFGVFLIVGGLYENYQYNKRRMYGK